MDEQIIITKKSVLSFYRDYEKLSIPVFQREYSWTEENLAYFMETIFQDIQNKVVTENEIYLGSLVCAPLNDNNKILSILDGQQRLTTILILFLFLNKKYHDKKNWQFNSQQFSISSFRVLQNFINNNGQLNLKLESHNKDRVSLLALLNNESIASKTIENAVAFFDKNFQKLAEAYPEYDLINHMFLKLNKMYVSLVLINGSNNVQDIFESINSSAKPLTITDLIINNLLMHINEEEMRDIYFKKYVLKWKDKLSGKLLDDFFSKYISILNGYQYSDKDRLQLFFHYKQCLHKYEENYQLMFSDIDAFFDAYLLVTRSNHQERLISPNLSDLKTIAYIEIINSLMINSTHGGPTAFVLIYFKYLHLVEKIKAREYSKMTHLLCDYIVKNSISAKKGKTMQRELIKLCLKIENAIKNGYSDIISETIDFFNNQLGKKQLDWKRHLETAMPVIDEPMFIYKLYFCLMLRFPKTYQELDEIKKIIANKKRWGQIYDVKKTDHDYLFDCKFSMAEIDILSQQVGNCIKFDIDLDDKKKMNLIYDWTTIQSLSSENDSLDPVSEHPVFDSEQLKKRNHKILTKLTTFFGREIE